MSEIKNFRDLRVWQAGMDLVERVYKLTKAFPREETYALATQTQRAAVSVPSNIAEGHTREHSKEYAHHLSMSQASLAEVETQIEIAARLGYVPNDKLVEVMDEIKSLRRQLFALRNALLKRQGAGDGGQGSA